jgi:hypothetical protein
MILDFMIQVRYWLQAKYQDTGRECEQLFSEKLLSAYVWTQAELSKV